MKQTISSQIPEDVGYNVVLQTITQASEVMEAIEEPYFAIIREEVQ